MKRFTSYRYNPPPYLSSILVTSITMITSHLQTYARAARDALGFPSLMLVANMMGFGSLARESGLTLGMALSTTAGVWGLPGQVALVELHMAGVSAVFVILACSLANARFMPMAVSLIPLIRDGVGRYGWMFVLVQLLSINSWAAGQRAFPDIAKPMRVHYYVLFATIYMTAGLIGTAIGFFSIGIISRPFALGLLFLNPLFFAVLICGTTSRPFVLAILIGILLSPVFHLISAQWGLLATGFVGGTIAFWLHRRRAIKDG